MKRVIVAMLTAVLVVGAQTKNEAERMFKVAQNAEVVDGDLQAAIEQYDTIASKFSKTDRAASADALVRMAECYTKLGDDKARKIYERVVREYSDQREAVAVARARLGGSESAATGSSVRAVWTGPDVDIFGRVSPDGRFFSYVNWNNGDLMMRDLVSGANHSLTNKKSWEDQNGAFGLYSAFSRDGKHLAYAWGLNPDRAELKVAALSGTALGETRRLPLGDEYPKVRPYDWSPDGEWIAVHLRRADQSGVVGVVAVEDGSVRALRSTGWRDPSNMAFSADGQFVAFDLPARDGVAQRDVFVLAIDGSRGGKAVENSADDTLVGFSPDGRQLLFTSDRTGASALWAQPFSDGKLRGSPVKVRPDFGSPWIHGITRSGALYITKAVNDQDIYVAPIDLAAGKLTAAPVGIQAFPMRGRPQWSADGEELSFIDCGSFGSGPCALFVRNMKTSQTRQVRHTLHYVIRHRRSPDGRWFITPSTDLKGRKGIVKIDAVTGETTPVPLVPRSANPNWSEDGRKIIYAHEGLLREHDLASGDEREICSIPADLGGLSVSPGGQSITYIKENKADGTSKLMMMPTDGGPHRELMRVREPESFRRLSWALGGSALLVAKGLTTDKNGAWEFWLAQVSGDAPRKLDIDVSNWSMVARISPDGSQIAAMIGKSSLEVWALENFLPAPNASE